MTTSVENLLNDMTACGAVQISRQLDGTFFCIWTIFSDSFPKVARSVASAHGSTPALALREAHTRAKWHGLA